MRVLATGLLLAGGLTFSAIAFAKLSKTGGGAAGFHASGPAGMAIDGNTSDVSVSDDGTNVVVTVKLTGIKTGMDLRDEHTRKALETDKFPTTELKVARANLKFPSGGESSGEATGSLKLHGQTKDVKFKYTATPRGDGFDVKADIKQLNMKQFGIEPPTYLGVGVKPEVDVSVSFSAKDG